MSELTPSTHEIVPPPPPGWSDLEETDFVPAVRSAVVQRLTRPSLSYWQDAWIRLKKNKQSMISLTVVALLLLFTLAGPHIWRASPSDQDLSRISEKPSVSNTAIVAADADAFQDIVIPGIPEKPEPPTGELAAPAVIGVIGVPSAQSVRLQWSPVTGAAGYVVYRSDRVPDSATNLGVPITEVEGGNRVSYEDQFNLEPKTYYYSVVAKYGEESRNFVSTKVTIAPTITLADAQKFNPDAKIGDVIRLAAHPLGTDYLGRDLLSRLMYGARISLFIGFFAPLLATILGALIGGIAGYKGGRTDNYLMRFTDFVLALPFLLFMILFKIAFGVGAGESGVFPMLVSLVVLTWTGPARLIRGQILQLRESEFVQASRLLGARPGYLLLRHLLPNTMGVILVSLTFSIPDAIFTEAWLSFIGMGVVPPTPSWGSMCNDGIQTFLTHPHEFLFPALLICLSVLSFNLLGDGLRDALDPRMRSVQ